MANAWTPLAVIVFEKKKLITHFISGIYKKEKNLQEISYLYRNLLFIEIKNNF